MTSDPTSSPIPPPPPPPSGSHPTAQMRSKSGWAIASLVLGIIGLCGGFPAILALVFGFLAKKQIAEDPSKDGDGLATAGIVLGIIGIVVLILGLIFIVLGGES